MRIVKFFLPGRFEDAYVYMERLIVLTEDRTLRVYNLDQIVDSIETRFPGSLPIPTLLFLRNDWPETSQFKSLMRNKEVARSLLSAFERLPHPYVKLDEDRFHPEELELDISARVLL